MRFLYAKVANTDRSGLQILKGLEAEGRRQDYEQFWELCGRPPPIRDMLGAIATQMAVAPSIETDCVWQPTFRSIARTISRHGAEVAQHVCVSRV